jgi:proteasome lid subunit RPN8/RPN11
VLQSLTLLVEPMALIISSSLFEQLRQHGEQTYPHECCGVLVGEFDEIGDKTVKTVVRCGNTRTDSPHNRYHISPAELVRVQRQSRLTGHDIIGFYHSHPDHPAQWSSTDLAEAHWTGCSYVITSVEKGRAVTTNSFLLLEEDESKRFADEAIVLRQDTNADADEKSAN